MYILYIFFKKIYINVYFFIFFLYFLKKYVIMFMYKLKGVIQIMFYKLNEYVYLKKNKYTFKEETILDNGRTIYCLVAVKGGVVHGLLQSLIRLTKDEVDEAISNYLKSKRRLISFEYTNAKEVVELVSYRIGNK